MSGVHTVLNKEFGEFAASCCDRIVLIGEKQTAAIREGIEAKGFPKDKLMISEEFSAAMQKLYALRTDKKKIILLENDLPDNY